MNKEIINVKKRNGRGTEPLNIEKIHEMVEYACEDITGVSSSQVEMKSGLQFYDGISTDEIQQILVKSAADLIDLNNPNYTYVASRLLLYSLRKQVIGKLWDHPHFYDFVKKNVERGLYDDEIFKNYQRKDFDRMENWLNHMDILQLESFPHGSLLYDIISSDQIELVSNSEADGSVQS